MMSPGECVLSRSLRRSPQLLAGVLPVPRRMLHFTLISSSPAPLSQLFGYFSMVGSGGVVVEGLPIHDVYIHTCICYYSTTKAVVLDCYWVH